MYNINMKSSELSREIVKKYQDALLKQYDSNEPFMSFSKEQFIFNFVKNGDVDGLNALSNTIGNTKLINIGKMSKDAFRQYEYAVVSGITLATRYAISGGLPDIEAYKLSDTYIQQLITIKNENEAISLFIAALNDFTKRVKKIKIKENYSMHVHEAIKYINTNLHTKIDLKTLAKHCGVTPQHLSSVFHHDVNMTIGEYIRQQKLKIAAQMLEQSDYSINKISNILSFPSQSAFTNYFKNLFGTTPNRYRIISKNNENFL